jgi:hypothetical protein
MDRIYLYVPPEEYPEVKALGASWDEKSKCWYISTDTEPAKFSPWLPDDEDEGELNITSDEAYVVSAQVSCRKCQSNIEVICVYCEDGTDSELDEPLEQFTVSNIWAMDDALARQLERWPFFKKGFSSTVEGGYFANHCPHCGTLQDDMYLHDEPGDPFHGIPYAAPGLLKFTPLVGRIQLNGDYSFEA